MVVDDWIARWCAFHGTRLQAAEKEKTYRRSRRADVCVSFRSFSENAKLVTFGEWV